LYADVRILEGFPASDFAIIQDACVIMSILLHHIRINVTPYDL